MLQAFIEDECVSKGMCADVSIHDTDGHNPHAHILLTVRPLDPKGKWQAKTRKEYLCRRNDEEKGFTAEEFKAAQNEGWEKLYQYYAGDKKVYMTPSEAEAQGYKRISKYPKSTRYGRQNPVYAEWNSDEQIVKWRKAWETITNRALEQKNIQERVDCRSFAARGITEQPTIHEGVYARVMAQKGIPSDRIELNRQIKQDNALLRLLKEQVKKLTAVVENTVEKLARALESIRSRLIVTQYQLLYSSKELSHAKIGKQVISNALDRYRSICRRIKQKENELDKLTAEKAAIAPIHILQRNRLTNSITTLTEDIEELRSEKAALLSRMHCPDESLIPEFEKSMDKYSKLIKTASEHNDKLNAEKDAAKAEYAELSSAIPPEDIDDVQVERYFLRNSSKAEITSQLQSEYGDKFDYELYQEATDAITKELGEKPVKPSLIHKRKQLQSRISSRLNSGSALIDNYER